MTAKKSRASCGLDLGYEADVESAIEGACGEGYDFVCVDIVNPTKKISFLDSEVGDRLGDLSKPEFMLKSQEWSSLVVGKLSRWLSLASDNHFEKALAEQGAIEELNFAAYLSLPAVLISIQSDKCANLAKIIYTHLLKSHHNMSMWVNVPLSFTKEENKDSSKDTEDSVNTWNWWNKFRFLCNEHNRIGVALEITADLPDSICIKQWLGEPIRAVILPTSIFLLNKKGYPVLSRAHQYLMMQLFRLNCQIIITGSNHHDCGMRVYQQYISHIYEKRPPPDQYEMFSKGYEDYLQSPLQPLMDNLESATYEVFEKDPVKYTKYQEAIYKCLINRVSDEEAEKTTVVLMVLGAGRGPLVRAALQAAKSANRKVKCYAVEKNVNATVTLNLLRRTEWKDDDVTVVSCDMRVWSPSELADIIVSELLGSFGDNELSPECLDGAERFLKQDAVSIPCSYTSYMSPASSQKLFNEVTSASGIDCDKPKQTAFETPYVVRIHNYHELAKAKPVFTFTHPNFSVKKDSNSEHLKENSSSQNSNLKNCRSAELSFEIPCDSLLHGFAGYFHCTLYDDVFISIVPESHSPGMFSWFPIFFPLRNPIHVTRGCDVSVNIWRQCSSQKVWYEWAVTKPYASAIHNPSGRSYTIGL